MLEKTIIVRSEEGIHIRPAGIIVKATAQYTSEIYFIKDGQEFNAKSIMSLMTMAADQGEEVIIRVVGEDEEQALEGIIKLLNTGLN